MRAGVLSPFRFASIAAALVLALSSCSGKDEPKDEDFSKAPEISTTERLRMQDEAKIEKASTRGEYLVNAVAACGRCHGEDPADPSSPLSGGAAIEDEHGSVEVPNITPSMKTGIGDFQFAEVVGALRSGIAKDEERISIGVHQGYRWMRTDLRRRCWRSRGHL